MESPSEAEDEEEEQQEEEQEDDEEDENRPAKDSFDFSGRARAMSPCCGTSVAHEWWMC